MDRQLVELQKLKFDKRECPCCGELLETPTPLKPMACPVCRAGKIMPRKADERWCPICRSGALKTLKNESPIKLCPICTKGRLKVGGLLRNRLACESCGAVLGKKGMQLTLIEEGKINRPEIPEEASGDSDSYWLPLSGRAKKVVHCETCRAHWDEDADGSMSLFRWDDDPFGVARKYQSLTKAEWALVGLRLKPDAGNATCSRCDADFFLEENVLVPLTVHHDPYGFMGEYRGCRLDIDAVRFLGVYKASGKLGPVCGECRTEFDEEGDYLRLRATSNERLASHLEEARPLEDWHRIARGLPAIDEETEWRARFNEVLRMALLTGEVPWADRKKPEVLWRSDAELIDQRARGRMLLYADCIEFQNRKHGVTAPLDVIRSISLSEGAALLDVVGHAEPLAFAIINETVSIDLSSGKRNVVLEASDFVDALDLAKKNLGA